MADGAGRDGDDGAPREPSIDRRTLVKLVAAGGALVGVPALLGRIGAANARAPFADVLPGSAHASVRPRGVAHRTVPPPATIVSRAGWHADEHIRNRAIDFDHHVEKVIVHHTGTRRAAPSWPEEVVAIYRDAVARGYRDMPYHWLIDPDGVVYEGRWARAVAASATPDGENRHHWSVRGGHALGHNERTLGVALLGTFDDHRPTLAAYNSLVALLAWKCDRWRIDPNRTSEYRLTDGRHQRLPNLCPHRRVRPTDCPGRAVVDLLPSLRRAVAERLA
jgi:N-acetylmuramoyl-L-alanine amidase-like protein